MNSKLCQRHWSHLPATALGCAAVCFGAVAATVFAAEPTPSAPQDPAKVNDLTSLSLQELYNLDIVQMNVLGGHTHPAGQTMFGYYYMFMDMEGIKKGAHEISVAEAMKDFPTVHTRMTMEEHMFEVMHAPTDDLTLMAMLPYKRMAMDHEGMAVGHQMFTQHADGIGDLELMGMYTLLGDVKKGGHRLLLNAGVSVPTGSINVRDHRFGDPAEPRVKLEYPMQLGSGTVDLMPGLTYLGDKENLSWGAQAMSTVRLGLNDSGYRFGNQYRLNAWGAYGVTDWFAPYLRMEGRMWGNIKGRDPEINPNATAEGNPERQAGQRVDLLFGMSFFAPHGPLNGTRLTVEGGFPVYEWLKGPQLGTKWLITAGASYAF